MSVMDGQGKAVSIERDPFAELAEAMRRMIGGSRVRRKRCYMFMLHQAGFSMEQLADDFGLHKGNVSRGIRKASADFLKAAESCAHDG
jgi:hypothetical protein